MRIRKTVSKLLGSAIVYPSRHFSPPPDLWAPLAMDNASGLVCELNQSPWDVYPNLHLFNDNFQDLEPSIISKKEEAVVETKEETQKVILENTGAIVEISDNPIRLCQKPTSKSSKKRNEKRKKKKKKEAIILCKKNDGKKWYCKRPAHLPHSLCEYHLSQSRSYYNTNKEKELASQFYVECEPTKRRRKSRKNGGGGASPYYYYNGFGPSTRKRRGGMSNGGGSHDSMHVADEERLDGCDAPRTGLDEEYDEEVAGELVSDPNEEEIKRVSKKRGRKPVKCRSLKSLL